MAKVRGATAADAAPPVQIMFDSTQTNVVQGASSAEAGPTPKINNDINSIRGNPGPGA